VDVIGVRTRLATRRSWRGTDGGIFPRRALVGEEFADSAAGGSQCVRHSAYYWHAQMKVVRWVRNRSRRRCGSEDVMYTCHVTWFRFQAPTTAKDLWEFELSPM